MRTTEDKFCTFHVVLGRLSTVAFWGVNCKSFRQALGGSLFFPPRGVSKVVTVARDQIDKSRPYFYVVAALKIRGEMTVSLVHQKLDAGLRDHFPAIFQPAVPVPLQVKGLAGGWDHLCRRLLASGFGPTPPTVDWEVLPEDREDFNRFLAPFKGAGGPLDTRGRARRPDRKVIVTRWKGEDKGGPCGGKGGSKK